MKTTITLVWAVFTVLMLTAGASIGATAQGQSPETDRADKLKKAGSLPVEICNFAKAKRRQAEKLADIAHEDIPPEALKFFDATAANDFPTAYEMFLKLMQKAGTYGKSRAAMWQPLLETEMAAENFSEGEPKYAFAFGKGIIESIPKGSIYFGGTDPGRGLVTALCRSHEDGDPFFVLTQNALADGSYLSYLRQMYGSRIYIPNESDSQRAFSEYLSDAQRRLDHDTKFPNEPRQMKPGEDVRTQGGRVEVSGQVAVMDINGRLVKIIFEKNPDREFYIEESFPLDWMYPYLSPHGLIFKLNRRELDSLSSAIVAKDEAFWTAQADQMIGPWLTPQSSVKEVCAFASKVFGKKDLSGFGGDPKFVKDDYAFKSFSKLRSSIGGLYAWRRRNAKDAEEIKRMQASADFAFKQAYAFCPISPEALYRYVQLLLDTHRTGDAILLAETTLALEPKEHQIAALLEQLRKQPH